MHPGSGIQAVNLTVSATDTRRSPGHSLRGVTLHEDRVRRKVIAAWYGSRGLAYLSTAYYVFRLNCWVRNETRCFPKAMAAITTCCLLLDARCSAKHFNGSQGPDLNRSVVDLQSTAWPLRHLGRSCNDTLSYTT